ncbi:TPA: hypothetical protein I7730_14110 [Vibrio vulnificus]|uniref:Uncharacterized protein n=1 Tax=Vibrio vulnificus TaxID=672 RepID=A0A8H9N158_VIBVL|nr:hypothetical protein [Vibrio vulnificus]
MFLFATSFVLLAQEKERDFNKDFPTCFLDGWVDFFKTLKVLCLGCKEAFLSKKAAQDKGQEETPSKKPE